METMSTITPWPWKIDYNTDDFAEPDEEDLANRRVISISGADGSTVYYTEDGYFKGKPKDITLIRAAPETLDALIALVDSCFQVSGLCRPSQQAFDKARAAIAEATGAQTP